MVIPPKFNDIMNTDYKRGRTLFTVWRKHMIPLIPKEIEGKITFIHHGVKVKEGIKLTEEERKIFEKFRDHIKKQSESRMD